MTAGVQLTIRYGMYGEMEKSVVVPISEDLLRELMGKLELSNEPFSLMLASAGLHGGIGNVITARRKTFKMRRNIAEHIAQAMVPELLKVFGVNDELDGYRISEMDDDEREWHKQRGRFP